MAELRPISDADYQRIWDVLREVRQERMRQHDKWGEQHHPTVYCERHGARGYTIRGGASMGLPPSERAKALCDATHRAGIGSYGDILVEEVAEAIDAATEDAARGDGDESATRAELVQVAAVAVAMIEAIDRRKAVRGAR